MRLRRRLISCASVALCCSSSALSLRPACNCPCICVQAASKACSRSSGVPTPTGAMSMMSRCARDCDAMRFFALAIRSGACSMTRRQGTSFMMSQGSPILFSIHEFQNYAMFANRLPNYITTLASPGRAPTIKAQMPLAQRGGQRAASARSRSFCRRQQNDRSSKKGCKQSGAFQPLYRHTVTKTLDLP